MKKGQVYAVKKIKAISSFDFNLNATCNSVERMLNKYAAELHEKKKNENPEEYFLINKIEQEEGIKSLSLENKCYRKGLFLRQTLELFYKNILVECEYPISWEEKVKECLERRLHYEENELTKFIIED